MVTLMAMMATRGGAQKERALCEGEALRILPPTRTNEGTDPHAVRNAVGRSQCVEGTEKPGSMESWSGARPRGALWGDRVLGVTSDFDLSTRAAAA